MPGFIDLLYLSASLFENAIEGLTGLHDLADVLGRWVIVTTDIGRMALDHTHFFQDFVLAVFQLLRQLREEVLQILVVILVGQFLRPVTGEVEVAAAVVQLTGVTRRRLVVLQQAFSGFVQGQAQQARPLVVLLFTQFFQGNSRGQELAQRVPAQVIFCSSC